jgi:RNA polymerase sigma-70 factor (ECF subfamily)
VPEKPPAPNTRWAREDEDVKLMLRFKAGQRAAFEELVRRNTHKVHALVYRFLGNPGLVEDLTQEVFLRVYRTAGRYQPTAKFSTWLYRIVANLSFNVLRSQRSTRPVSLELGAADDGETFTWDVSDPRLDAPHSHLDAMELREKVAEAINALPTNQKIAIVLNKYEHKSYEEIAAILKCSTMAVKSLLSRARGNLRSLLGRYLRQDSE